MNSAGMLWEVITAKREFWQAISKQVFMQKLRLLKKREGDYSFSSREPLPYVMVEISTLELLYQHGFPLPLQEQKSGAAGRG